MKKSAPMMLAFVAVWALASCSQPEPQISELGDTKDPRLQGDAILTVTGLPEGAKVVTMAWFEGRDDDHFQGELYEYSDGMTIPAGKLMFLIEGEGYEPLIARRIPVFGETVLQAKMCKIDEDCRGTLKRLE